MIGKFAMNMEREALPPAQNDRFLVVQDDPKSGRATQRWITRAASEAQLIGVVDAAFEERLSLMQASIDALAARKYEVLLPDVTIAASQLVTLTTGERTFANLPCAGVLTTDTLRVSPKSMPSGFGIRGWSIPRAGRIDLRLQCPVLTVGTAALTVSVSAIR